MKPEIVRKMDDLGRIIIPVEMQSALGWDEKTKISISRQGEQLVLQTHKSSCMICESEVNLKPVHGKYICRKCMNEMTR